ELDQLIFPIDDSFTEDFRRERILLEHFTCFEFHLPYVRLALQTRTLVEQPVPIEQSFREGGPVVRKCMDYFVTIFGNFLLGGVTTRACRERRQQNQCAHRRTE